MELSVFYCSRIFVMNTMISTEEEVELILSISDVNAHVGQRCAVESSDYKDVKGRESHIRRSLN